MGKNDKKKKVQVYECEHYEYDYDDLGKYHWCHNQHIPSRECTVGTGIYCQKFCPGYKKGNLRGSWVISNWEKKDAEEYKKKIAIEAKENETKERALYEYLKNKYG